MRSVFDTDDMDNFGMKVEKWLDKYPAVILDNSGLGARDHKNFLRKHVLKSMRQAHINFNEGLWRVAVLENSVVVLCGKHVANILVGKRLNMKPMVGSLSDLTDLVQGMRKLVSQDASSRFRLQQASCVQMKEFHKAKFDSLTKIRCDMDN